MEPMYYVGLDVHKRKISYWVKDGSGRIHAEGSISATRLEPDHWMRSLPQPWSAAMEATMFTGWIYDHLKPHAAVLKVAHPLMLRAIGHPPHEHDKPDDRRCEKFPGLPWRPLDPVVEQSHEVANRKQALVICLHAQPE